MQGVADWDWGLQIGSGQVADDGFCVADFGLIMLRNRFRCPRCGSEDVQGWTRYTYVDGIAGPRSTKDAESTDVFKCGECKFETEDPVPFEECATEYRRSQEPPTAKPPRLRRLRETVALWLAPWVADRDDEGW